MSDNELLLAISEMLDKKLESNLKPIENRLKRMELQIENNVIPRLQNIPKNSRNWHKLLFATSI